jgi:pyruvate dehydrogenase E2 component (dihydrolipoamide acetyltransferase)
VGKDAIDKPLSHMRKTIARRMAEAKATVPHFYLTTDCDAGGLMSFRQSVNDIAGAEKKVSVNDILIKAVALALRKIPEANVAYLGEKIRHHARVHVGVAVAIEDGLVTVVVRDADQKGVGAIGNEMRDLGERAKARKLRPEEMTGATFTLSNLGMFGIDHFAAIINPPEAAILAVGAVRRQPVVMDGDMIVVGQRMSLTLSCDHRAIDGATGARFLAELVKMIERPPSLAL